MWNSNQSRRSETGGIFFGVYMAITFLLAWAYFTPALSLIKAALITIIGISTLSSLMYSMEDLFRLSDFTKEDFIRLMVTSEEFSKAEIISKV